MATPSSFHPLSLHSALHWAAGVRAAGRAGHVNGLTVAGSSATGGPWHAEAGVSFTGGQAVAGSAGQAVAGSVGQAVAGSVGRAVAGSVGQAVAGSVGLAVAGSVGQAVAGSAGQRRGQVRSYPAHLRTCRPRGSPHRGPPPGVTDLLGPWTGSC